MIRVMADSERIDSLPANVPLLATYSDLVTDLPELRARFPHSEIILIDRGLGDPTGQASVADVETGSLTVEQFGPWADRKRAAGIRYVTCYCNRSTLPRVNALTDAGTFARWVATLDGTAHIDGYLPLHEPQAVQLLTAAMAGIDADISLVLDDTWHPESEPVQLTEARALAVKAMAATNDAGLTVSALAKLLTSSG